MLPDPERRISKQQCRLEYRDDCYFVIDKSANGTFLNGQRLPPGKPVKLNDGDTLALCNNPPVYELRVSIRLQQKESEVPGGDDGEDEKWWEPRQSDVASASVPEPYTVPDVPAGPQPAQPPTSAAGKAALQAFFQGAELPELPIAEADIPKLLYTLGQLYRQTVQGLHELLQARSTVKTEFRIPQHTMIGSMKVNPIKFMAADMAMEQLLTQKNPSCLPAAPALREVFTDLKAHEVAIMAGIQAALSHLLNRFDPQNLELHISKRSILDNILPANRKAKYWEEFLRLYTEIAREAQDDFQKLFEGEFERAYQQQVDQLLHHSGDKP